MKIQKIIRQHRRDFTAIYECEHCGHEIEASGYDDDNFHRNVIPLWECDNCQEKSTDSYRPIQTKYAEGEVV